MNTNGNTESYNHRLMTYTHATRTANLGTVQYFWDVCPTNQWSMKMKYGSGPQYNT